MGDLHSNYPLTHTFSPLSELPPICAAPLQARNNSELLANLGNFINRWETMLRWSDAGLRRLLHECLLHELGPMDHTSLQPCKLSVAPDSPPPAHCCRGLMFVVKFFEGKVPAAHEAKGADQLAELGCAVAPKVWSNEHGMPPCAQRGRERHCTLGQAGCVSLCQAHLMHVLLCRAGPWHYETSPHQGAFGRAGSPVSCRIIL